MRDSSSVGRALASQAEGRGFESRLSLSVVGGEGFDGKQLEEIALVIGGSKFIAVWIKC